MGASVLRPGESEPFDRNPPEDRPLGNVPAKDGPERPDSSRSARLPDARLSGPLARSFGLSSSKTAQAVDPPWKPVTTPKRRHALFEGDAAAIELRSRLAQTRDGALLPVPPDAPAIGVPMFGAVLRFTGVALTAAVAVAAAGYLASGVKLPFKPARIAAPSGEVEAPPTPVTLAPQLNESNRAPLPAAQPAAIEQASRPAAPPLSQPPSLPRPDAPAIVARPKLGAEQVRIGSLNEAERDALWRQFVIWRQQQRK